MIKNLLLFTFYPHRINKDFIHKNIQTSKILFLLFLFHCIAMSIAMLIKPPSFDTPIFAVILFAGFFGTYIYTRFEAFILYLVVKLFNKKLKYKTCHKLVLPGATITALSGFIFTIIIDILHINIGIAGGLFQVLSSILILSYYLKNLYKFKNTHLITIGAAYLFIYALPKVLEAFINI